MVVMATAALMLQAPYAYAGPVEDAGSAILQFLGIDANVEPSAAFDEEKTVDPSTIATWSDIIQNDTENIGRIWTDKTVSSTSVQLPASPDGTAPNIEIGDSDFLVTLSALSSTSNTTTTSSKPLDIVLVLDASGSMGDELTSEYRYNEAYNINTNGRTTYYARNADGSYAEIERVTRTVLFWQEFDHWELDGQTVNPKTSTQDSDPNHIQFYTYDEVTTTKMAALHDAANAFIENTASQNDAIDDVAKQHRISLVKFASDKSNTVGNDTMGGRNDYNYSQIMTNLTAYTSDDVASATSMVDDLTASGATSADYGMQHAQTVLASAREDAQKVVIFFTDGEPNHQSGFDGTVANDAISAAGALKDENTLVYTIGMFADADPGNTSTSTTNRFNAYMHAVSSNYPKASAWNRLGERVSQDSAYYKAATNAAELNQIFQEISDEINAGTGYPTETTEGAEGTSGYITFTDELGAYTEVDGFKSIVFADKVFSNPEKSSNGLTDTYTFEGEGGNALYPNGNLNQIEVTVQRSDELAQGDVVTVKVPAGLIPLRSFTVADENGAATMDVAEVYPMHIFYGVSVKQGVYDALAQGAADQALKNYIAANTADGKTSFYSNYYDGTVTSGGKKLGNTTASFVPAEGNSFYYFTRNTTLYTDENCTQKLMTEPHTGDTYYYKRAYYAKDAQSGEVTKKDSITRFVGANFSASTTFWGQASDGSYYIKAGAPRITRIDDLTLSKKPNATGTASEVINPNWDNIDNPDVLNVSLGNNGKIDIELPGTLAITKDAGVAPNKGLSTDVLNNKEFQFEITVDGAASRTYKAEVKHEDGTVTGALFDLAFDGQGKAIHFIKDNETLYIYGLDAGAAYAVAESTDKLPSGFTQTSATGDTGTIPGNATAQAKFVNTYDVAPVTLSAADFATYQKNFDRWDIADSFYIRLTEDNAANPMPEGSAEGANGLEEKAVQVSGGATSGNFGDITFDRAGTFTYIITEPAASSAVPGITYSQAAYSVTVTVADKGDGALEATSTMKRVSSDTGAGVDEAVDDKNAVFTNSFDVTSVNIGPRATKVYTNNGGADMNLADGMFTFKVTAVGGNAADAPMPEGEQTDDQGNRFVTVVNDGPEVAFGQATFTDKHVGHTYTYEIREVLPSGATAENGYTVNGMTYDNSYYTATFTVSSEVVEGKATVKVERSYTKGDEATAVAGDPTFTNSYDPTDVTLEGDTAIAASKTLVGRDSQMDEIFGFMLVARGNATQKALKNHEIVFNGNNDTTKLEASVYGLTNGQAKVASFGSIAFTKPGTYSFDVTEKVPASDADGMVYDRSAKTVTVTVTDEDGVLKASVTYPDGASAAAFTNTYASSYTYGTGMKLDAGKTLDGRAQKAGEFSFSIKGVAKDGSVTAADAESKLAESDKSFSTIADAHDGVQSKMFNLLSGVKFSQDDAGKTFSYELSEVVPSDDDKLGGVTYDTTVYAIDITPADNADGTMHAVTNINKKHADGTTELVGTYNSADGVDAATLGFTNTYKAASVTVDPATTPIDLSKVLTGRDWKASDSFEFMLTSENAGNPSHDVATKTVTQADGTPAGTEVPFNFGSATFDAPGQYHYTVTETNGGKTIDGVKYDDHTADIYVIVSDPGNGQLTARVNVYNGTFTNEYKAELSHNDAGGIIVTKTTNGHSMEQGQFQFRVETLDGDGTTAVETAKRIGITDGTTGDFGNIKGADGEKVEMPSEHPIMFTQADAGKTFKLKISERGADGTTFGSGGMSDGYTYSDAVYTVELSVADNGDGTLTLATKVTDKDGNETTQTSSAADKRETYLDFVNSYTASTTDDTDVNLEATKILNGRNMAAREFRFKVLSNPIDEAGQAVDVLTGGKNAAADNGKAANIDFGNGNQLDYALADLKKLAADDAVDRYVEAGTTDDGKPQYTVHYTALEETGSLPAGVTAVENAKSFDFIVTVVDNGDGTLTATPHYPAGGLTFVNTYKWNPVTIDPDDSAAGKVTKVLAGNRGTALTEGEFDFTMTTKATDGSIDTVTDAEGNAWPEKKMAKNAVDGSVDFGTMKFSEPGTYMVTIAEKTGAAGHMTYDGHKLTYTIKVTYDNATGKLTAAVEDAQGSPTFTNVYFDETDAKDVLTDPKDPTTSVDGKLVGVGDELTYTIDWVNSAVGEDGAPAKAEITVTDEVPAGTEFVGASEGGEHKDGTVTWSLGEQDPGASGTVTLTVKVANDAKSTVENQASITIGSNAPTTTNRVVVNVPQKTVAKPEGGDTLKVGDVLTYTISYKNTDAAATTVIITDKLPAGLTFVSADNSGVEQDGTITWTINDVQSGAEGVVTFTAKVNESAVDGIGNTATVKVGENGPVVNTNTTPNQKLEKGNASITKTVEVPEGFAIDKDQEFTFKVELLDSAGNALTRAYSYAIGDGDAQPIASGGAIALKHGETATIADLPEGARVKATEEPVEGYTADGREKSSAAVEPGKTAAIGFVNTYAASSVTISGEGSIRAQKDLRGRGWVEGDSFTAELAAMGGRTASGADVAEGDVPLPAGAEGGKAVAAMASAEPVSFGDITYTVPGTYTYRVTERRGNAGGITYSAAVYDVTVAVADDSAGELSASVAYQLEGAADGAEAPTIAAFTNTYTAVVPSDKPISTDGLFTKILTGRDWKVSDSFSFAIEPQDGAPAPEQGTATLVQRTDKAGAKVSFGFGGINFTFDNIRDVDPAADGTRTKEFRYIVTENVPADADKIAGITYDTREVALTVTLKDDGKGTLAATYIVANGPFVNTYKSGSVDVDDAAVAGGVQIVKTMTGRAIAEGDFEFAMTPANDDAKAKFGETKVIKTSGAALGSGADANTAVETMRVATGLMFNLEDAGKTFTFDVAETKGGGAGYTNDSAVHKLAFRVTDDTEGTLTVAATLDGAEVATWTNTVATRAATDVVSIPFANSYDAGSITVGGEGDVALTGTKTLAGRDMVAGEFHFNVVNAKDAGGTVVATGTNAADGSISFTGITYTTEQLNKDVAAGLATVARGDAADVYTYTYTVSEDASKNDEGITVNQGSQTIGVTVADNHAGKLAAEVAYPKGGMVFKNSYGAGAEAKVAINGTKVLAVESGDNAPDIAGRYTFTIAGSEGAPMPAKTTAANDAAGNVSFGEINYTMESVFGTAATTADAQSGVDAGVAGEGASSAAETDDGRIAVASVRRTKNFTYTVAETGFVAGVTNDTSAKTITVTVTDNGDGTLSVSKSTASEATDFTFVNTYSVTPQESSPTGEDGFAITKKLEGRDLRDGEFEFVLVSAVEGMPEVLPAANDVNGHVVFPAVTFSRPGIYKYTLAEVDGDLGGVIYDGTVYDITATVSDNGDGTLSVAWSAATDGGAPGETSIGFVNSYKPAGTSLSFAATKLLSGRDIVEGEFTFELLEGDRVISTAKNEAADENGAAWVFFKEIPYTEVGEHDYTIREVKGDAEGVTYDKAEFTYHVVVSDPGDGQLVVEWTEGENGAPVFKNTYTKPAEPGPEPGPEPETKPGKPSGSLAKTGDASVLSIGAALASGIAALGVGHIARRRR